MNKKLASCILYFLVFSGTLFLQGCLFNQDKFLTTPSGLRYQFHEQSGGSIGVVPGDMITANVTFRTMDTVFFVSSRDLQVPYQVEVLEPRFPGDFYDALLLMGKGDSATFILSGDSLFRYDFEISELPEFIGEQTDVYMDIRLLDVLPQEEFAREKRAYGQRVSQLVEELKEKEARDIEDYMVRNNFHSDPDSSGLYRIFLKHGNGSPVEPGKEVEVNYTAMFINGEIFETTIQDIAVKYDIFDSLLTYRPFTFIQGESPVIEGWKEGLSTLKTGDKVLLIIPSGLAYGEEGVEGFIGPYTPLVYEIEVISVKP